MCVVGAVWIARIPEAVMTILKLSSARGLVGNHQATMRDLFLQTAFL